MKYERSSGFVENEIIKHNVNVHDIMSTAEEHTYTEGLTSMEFSYGGKKLELFYNSEKNSFHGYIKNTAQQGKSKETTQLYTAALEYMQQVANAKKQPVAYTLRTQSESMIGWAEHAGEQLFNWDSKESITDTVHVFVKTIYPATK